MQLDTKADLAQLTKLGYAELCSKAAGTLMQWLQSINMLSSLVMSMKVWLTMHR